ncbi:uncharacterized protein EDB91DRAFT_1060983 [Suillus paluster]|uniref:uncharacterized protein n=1 Tax=Suillus paluster TaxID=48578 RepID=UPI001B8602C6|nr:uncharacterized protein EDB91DRAFT_1060983 [Suillus paluster]KAG1727663.1 hypothetical protein EDB91DRAFT_1060983 [Suillus paluster]
MRPSLTTVFLALLDEIAPHILRLWKTCQTDRNMVHILRQKHIDTEHYGIGLTKLREIREGMGLRRTRQQGHTIESIRDAMIDLRQMYLKAGIREVISLLFHERDMSVARSVVSSYFAVYEPELVRERKSRCLKRRRFWAAGVNDLFAVDQHDKWLRFGLGLHTGIEPFSGRIMWICVWHSNRNPQLILSYYLNTIEELGYMLLITQSDLGTENFRIANAQTLLRQCYDPDLRGMLQHRWMRSKKNVMPEITWSQLRRCFTPAFETLLDHGVNEGWYDVRNTLQNMVFCWVFIPWLQQELDVYIQHQWHHLTFYQILPHGVPSLIYDSPKDFNALDFKVTIDRDGVDHVRELYINSAHPVFDIVPPTLGDFIQHCYDEMGCPEVTRTNVWIVYRNLLSILQLADNVPPTLLPNEAEEDSVLPLLEGCSDLPFCEEPNGPYYMGGVGGGLGLGMGYNSVQFGYPLMSVKILPITVSWTL